MLSRSNWLSVDLVSREEAPLLKSDRESEGLRRFFAALQSSKPSGLNFGERGVPVSICIKEDNCAVDIAKMHVLHKVEGIVGHGGSSIGAYNMVWTFDEE